MADANVGGAASVGLRRWGCGGWRTPTSVGLRRWGCVVGLRWGREVAESLTEELRVLLYHAVRELCGNVVKHARAPRAVVYVHADWDQIRIVVDDAGEGFDSAKRTLPFNPRGGFGLFAIRQMSSRIGGSFQVDSAPGNGTFAVLSVPLA